MTIPFVMYYNLDIKINGIKINDINTNCKQPGSKEHIMLSLTLTLVLMPVVVFLGLTVQRWLFSNSAEQNDPEWELYQQRYD